MGKETKTKDSYFNRKKLTEDEVVQVEERKEDVEYTCGGQIFQEPCLVFVEVKITCESHVSSNYYHKRKNFHLVCYVCGDENPLVVPPDVIESHSSAHPVCMVCSQKGYKPRLRKKSLCWESAKNDLNLNMKS
ncbi:uncharacterized protein LOC134248649 [Saccostrea cucullata]|uniref:uncharacterized protein LOC134248649 n=1 Tax=Saccostrea cuccullata TaxID=36930 RepID=UPI002ED14DAC